MNEHCEDCAAIRDLAGELYSEIDQRRQTVGNTVTAIATVLMAAIASCSDSDRVLADVTDYLKKTAANLQDSGVLWNQRDFPVCSHGELAEMIACCTKHVPAEAEND